VAEVLKLPPDQLPDDASTETMEGWDSLKHLDIVLAIEMKTGVKFKTDEIPHLTSLAALQATVDKLRAGE